MTRAGARTAGSRWPARATSATTTTTSRSADIDIDALGRGAALLGSGGGGNVGVGVAIARRAGPAALVSAAGLDPETLVIHVGIVGAPSIVAERLVSGDEFEAAVRAVERHVGDRAGALGVIEIGGLNGVLPLAAAAATGLPLVDGDLMGRAFPRLDQTTLAAAGIAAGPVALVDPTGDLALLDSPTSAGIERILRAVVTSIGGSAAIACHPVRAGTLAEHGIAGSVMRALELGAREPPAGEVLFAGRVAEIRRDERVHSVVLEEPEDVTQVARIDMVSEYLAVTVNGTQAASVPDIICVLDADRRQPVLTDELRPGRHVLAVRIDPPSELRALPEDLVGPTAFGLV